MTSATNCKNRPPRLCQLLKTLLFLLSIYIKRASSVELLDLGATSNYPQVLEPKVTVEGDTAVDLGCPLEYAVEYKQRKTNYTKQLRKATIDKLEVIWLKDGNIWQRQNGQLIDDHGYKNKTLLTLLSVGTSDAGRYTCLFNYTSVPKEARNHFELSHSIVFDLRVETRASLLPDRRPSISHPPQNFLVNRGKDVTFTCNRIQTMTTQTTFWFSYTAHNSTAFLDKFNKSKHEQKRSYMEEFFLTDYHEDELTLHNVTDSDIGFYGCLVWNQKGIDIRYARLDLIEKLPVYDTTTTIQPLLDTNSIQGQRDHSTLPSTVFNDSNSFGTGKAIIIALMTFVITSILITSIIMYCRYVPKLCLNRDKKLINSDQNEPIVTIEGCREANLRQHLPNGDCPDIYNIGKISDGFISGHLHQGNGHQLTQSICTRILVDKEKNPSISSNSNSDEASSWGKSMSSHADSSRACYLHTSNFTATTLPLYDHPPSTGTSRLKSAAIVQDSCVINPTYGFLRPVLDANDWVFPRRNLERLNKIGEGQFGEVWRYIARQKDGNESYVAVKQLKNRAGLGHCERLELIAEIEIMKSINNHPNVIKLLHYCLDDYEPILLIMEYAEHGKLQTYLRNCRSARKLAYGCIDESSPVITSKELIKFSYHIAKGMEYVASKGIVHRDLASRNILVSKDRVCKVADFGFARRVTDECAYERTTTNPVPVKWMAPEALVENRFTTKSDVFSLGILMWEIVTLGATPYEYMTSPEVYTKVTSGGRLERPAHCKDEFYNIMSRCWLHDPVQRPTFKELAIELEQLLLSENDYIELDQYPEHAYYNIITNNEKAGI